MRVPPMRFAFEISFPPKLDGPVWFLRRVDIGFMNSLDTISWICGCAKKKLEIFRKFVFE